MNVRYVIRRKDDQHEYTYYTSGAGRYGCQAFDENINKAKIFKNVVGAKVACNDIYTHYNRPELEIVEVMLSITQTAPIKYVHPNIK